MVLVFVAADSTYEPDLVGDKEGSDVPVDEVFEIF